MAKDKISHPACLACGSADIQSEFERGGYSYIRCKNCNTLYVGEKLTTGDVHVHYNEDYYEADNAEGEDRQGYPSYREGRTSLLQGFEQKLNFVRRFASAGRLLDAGAAYGYFVKVAEPYFQSSGLEVSEYAAKVAREEFQADVIQGDIEHTRFGDAEFDVVVMWDIIEHVIHPEVAIREVCRILKPGGYLFISTDDAANWLPRLLGKHWWALAAPLHLCHFSKNGITRLCANAGLVDIEFHSDPRHYTIPGIIKHFGVSYGSKFLQNLGDILEKTLLGQWELKITRPEQFVVVARKTF